jgi:rhamnogalacturonan endolyase
VLSSGAVGQTAAALPKIAKVTVNQPVTLTDNGDSWTRDNGIVKMTIPKRNGNLSSLVYRGIEILTRGQYWEQVPSGIITANVTIDPATNGGERAEVSVKGVYNGDNTPTPGGSARSGSAARRPAGAAGAPRGSVGLDIETRFTLEGGVSGFYTYAEYTHHASYPRAGEGESRFILEDINPTFDWLSVDKDRNQLMSHAPEDHEIHAKEQSIYTTGIYKNSVEHKYSYNAPMYKLQAWGWSSTKDHIGVYFMNPSTEYIVGGPERLDLIDHMTAPGAESYRGIILDYWTSGHYAGGASNSIPAGEEWTHVVAPSSFTLIGSPIQRIRPRPISTN